jgi:sec-independent protein translocase protein TatC
MSDEGVLSIWEHIEELAERLRRIVFSVVLTTLLFAIFPSDLTNFTSLDFSEYRPLVFFIIEKTQIVLLPEEANLIAFNWLDTFYIYVIVSTTLGFILALPITANEIYRFLTPALYPHEKRSMRGFIVVFIFLFSLGALYAFYLLLPVTFHVLYRLVYQSRVIPFFSVKDFFNMVALGLVGSGIFYTFPLILYTLVRADLMELDTLKKNRKQVFVVMLVITAILPDPTPVTMFLMTIPFYVLYEATIQILVLTNKSKTSKVIEFGVLKAKELLSKNPATGDKNKEPNDPNELT